MTPEQQKAAMETMQQWRTDATQLPQPGLLATFWDDVKAYQEGRLQDIEPGLRENQAYMAQLATAPHLSGTTLGMDIVYTCSQCGHTQTRKAGGLYTANVPIHCGLVMVAKRQEPNDDTKERRHTVGEVRTAIIVDTNGQPGEVELILEELQYAGLQCNLVIQGRGIQQIKDSPVDLLILDYGGAAAFGSMELMEWQIDAARQYAEDHPSTLLVAWSSHTSRYYQEMAKAMPDLPNVLLRFGDTWDEQGVPALQKWFSISNETTETL